MNYSLLQLVPTQFLTAADAVYYTALSQPANLVVAVTTIWLANTNVLSHQVNVSLVASGGASGAGNRFIPTITLAPMQAIFIENNGSEILVLKAGDSIHANADVANTVNFTVIGRSYQ